MGLAGHSDGSRWAFPQGWRLRSSATLTTAFRRFPGNSTGTWNSGPDAGRVSRRCRPFVSNGVRSASDTWIAGTAWRDMNDGNGLSVGDLTELLKQRKAESPEIHGIRPVTEVREDFPNLTPTRNELAPHRCSLCDAVAKALSDGGRTTAYRTVKEAWEGYRMR